MSKKLATKISLPNKKQNRKGNGRHRSQRSGKRGGANMVPAGKNFGNTTTIMELSMPIFPAKCVKRLRYYDQVSVTSTSGSVGSYVFSCNGLYDPNITGTGHQPMGFDQMMLSYNHYAVLSAKITVTATNQIAGPATFSVSVTPSNTPVTVVSQIMEFGGNTSEALEGKGVSGEARVIQAACNIKKIQGIKDVSDDNTLRGDSANNPIEQSYFMVQAWNTLGLSGIVYFDVIIDYVALFNEPRILTQSLQNKMKQLILSEDLVPSDGKTAPVCRDRNSILRKNF
jgi:hypothetical protein